jgi:pimeloyl-ACP methyl ester carboxylesterase
LIDRGHGDPIVIIPGIQGRWEWMKPAIDALARRTRVITFSLADEPSAQARFDEHTGFRSYVDQVRDALDESRVDRARICGVSYGGLIAAAFAATYPSRVSSLVLVSAIPPSWKPDERVSFFLRAPWLLSPLFCAGSVRLFPEIAAANDTWWRGAIGACSSGIRALTHMFHPGRMARRVEMLTSARIAETVARVTVPVLVVTGEESLERVVPPHLTREYLSIWPHAQSATLARTGHLGLVTRPEDFATLITSPWQTSSERSQARQAR